MVDQVRSSQLVNEVLHGGALPPRVSQVVGEVLETGSNAPPRASQVVAEILETGAGEVPRVSQVVLEVLCWNPATAGNVFLVDMGDQ